ncbi:TRAP transporter substrate-binding protein [Mesorhizobium sp. 1B3]|uniref:TRAP transporter substrate-binding protein n=1 Tax=Mesorhizobium sp. 1B3 TaxID=3243599 RepID=UPI003D9900D7
MTLRKMLLAAGVAAAMLLGGGQAMAQQINWVYSNGYAKDHFQTGLLADEFFKRIADETDGRLKIRHVAGGALLKPENTIEGVRGKVANLGSTVVSFFPGQLPISATLASLVDLRYGNSLTLDQVADLTAELLEQVPEFSAEYEKQGLKPLLFVPSPAYAIISNDPITNLADLQGKKVRTLGNVLPKLMEAAGAVPLSVAFGEIYTSLQTGVLDGAMTDPPAMLNAKFPEIAKNLLTTGPEAGAFTAIAPVVFVVNLDDWNALPEDIRNTVSKVAAEMRPIASAQVNDFAAKSFGEMEAAGVTVHHLSQADTDALASKAPDFLALAVDVLKQNGLAGEEIIAKYRAIADSYLQAK